MIEFLPPPASFAFTDLYIDISPDYPARDVKTYPFHTIRYFFDARTKLPTSFLKLDETSIEDFDHFKEISMRDDHFYLIAYKYFIPAKIYSFEEKVRGIILVKRIGKNPKLVSFFDVVYNAIKKEADLTKSRLRQEYTLIPSRSEYIDKLAHLLLRDYDDLQKAIRKDQNVFSKYGVIINEVYIEIFRDFNANFVDYLSDNYFKQIKNLVYPSKKEVQSFRFAVRNNWKNINNLEARKLVLERMHGDLKILGYIDQGTTFEQITDLFSNRRRQHEKIIWQRTLTDLATFYKLMEEYQIVAPTGNLHWKILADYFTLQNSEIDFTELKEKKKSTQYSVIEELESVLHFVRFDLRA